MKVYNMTSPNGNKVANQFIIEGYEENGNKFEIFQSYSTTIAKRIKGKFILDANALEYSATTLKYLKLFLNTRLSKAELQKAINNNEYEVQDLNA